MKNILSDLFLSTTKEPDSELSRLSSELRVTLEKLKDEKEQREAILASMEEGVIVTDPKGNVTMANRKAEELFGKELLEKRVVEISRNPELHRIIEEGSKKGETVTGEITIAVHHPISLSVTMTPLIRNTEKLGSVIVFHEITLLKKLETMRIDFVANVSHELKTPLTAIKGFAETLKEGAINDKENAARFVDIIKENADRLSRLVEDLLTLSNIELGKVSFEIRPVEVEEVARTVISTLEPKAKAKGLSLELDIEKGVRALSDKDRLAQILLNLVDNGIKFTEKGSVKIQAQTTPPLPFVGKEGVQGAFVQISVTDTGTGIPPKDIPRLGERFYRVDPARSRELGGTGLGLAIVKHLVVSMNGKLSIESEYGKGTRISFTMPAAGN
ncbi:MAG: alkaline phosphatase synthesis sensor protein PhoR [Deltaproteobacteria bacterium]|nr:alkaline phosphatase synthesis sensor protein PhoR [Deltaproteobacteria bacterium]